MAKLVVDTEEVLELGDAARELGIGIATLFRRLKTGAIIPLHIGARTYITKSEITRVKGEAYKNQ
jgi:hypothetical protein